jgi:hypothetical protein
MKVAEPSAALLRKLRREIEARGREGFGFMKGNLGSSPAENNPGVRIIGDFYAFENHQRGLTGQVSIPITPRGGVIFPIYWPVD